MIYRIASARPWGRALTATLAAGFFAAAAMGSSAFAQQQKPAPKPPAAAPKQAPAAQPAAPQQPGAPGQQAGAEQPQLMYSPWMKVCGKGPDTNNKQVCVITKDGRLENGMPVAIVQLIRAGRRCKGAACHRSARHAACAWDALAHRPKSARSIALQHLLPGRLHGRLPGAR